MIERLAINHIQQSFNPEYARHGAVLQVSQSSGDAQLLIANPSITQVIRFASTDVGLSLKMADGATGNPFQVENFLGVLKAYFTPDGLLSVRPAAAGNMAFTSAIPDDAHPRHIVYTDGKHEWGTGTDALDTNLYRSAANWLKTDDSLAIAIDLTVGGTAEVTGATALKNTLTVTGATELESTLTVREATRLDRTLSVGQAVTLDSTLAVTDNVTVGATKFTVDAQTGNFMSKGTLDLTGVATLRSTLDLLSDLRVNTDKFVVTAASGNTSIAGTLSVTGAVALASTLSVTDDLAVGGTKFTVDAQTGNTALAGTLTGTGAVALKSTLTVDGATTLKSTLAVTAATTLSSTLAVADDLSVATNKFIVDAQTGDTLVAGRLTVQGLGVSFTGAEGTFAINANKFTVDHATGNTSIAGTLDVNSAANVAGNLVVGAAKFSVNASSGDAVFAGALSVTGALTLSSYMTMVGNLTVGTSKFTVNAANGDVAAAGDLNVAGDFSLAGAANLASALNVGGNLTLGSSVFTVNATTGNTQIAGTLNVAGATHLVAPVTLGSNLTVGADKFTVTASSGDITAQGALSLAGPATFLSGLTAGTSGQATINSSGDISTTGALAVTGPSTFIGDVTMQGSLTVNGNLTLGSGNEVVYIKATTMDVQDRTVRVNQIESSSPVPPPTMIAGLSVGRGQTGGPGTLRNSAGVFWNESTSRFVVGFAEPDDSALVPNGEVDLQAKGLFLSGGISAGDATFAGNVTFSKSGLKLAFADDGYLWDKNDGKLTLAFDSGVAITNKSGTAAANLSAATVSASSVSVSGDIQVTGTVDGVDVSALKSAYDTHNHDSSYPGMYTATIGDGISTSYTLTHGFSRNVIVQVYENNSPWAQVFPDIELPTATTVKISFLTAPTSNQFRVVVIGR